MGLKGKLVAELEVNSSADEFYHIYRYNPNHISSICSFIQAVELLDGEFGQPGSVICWRYTTPDGRKCSTKEVVLFDDATNTIIFEATEGEIMEDYKSLVIKLQCEVRGDENPDIVRWIIDYEKLKEDSPNPNSLFDYLLIEGRDIEAEHKKTGLLPKIFNKIV